MYIMIFNTKTPTEQELREIDVHELLPQQEPFVMIGALVHFDEKTTATETVIKAENIFVEDNRLSAAGLMENIAQTCAARIGYVNRYILKKAVQIGFIGAVRNFEVSALPQVGDTITTTVEVKEDIFGMTLAEAVVKTGGHTHAAAEIKIAVRDADSGKQ